MPATKYIKVSVKPFQRLGRVRGGSPDKKFGGAWGGSPEKKRKKLVNIREV